MRRGVTLIELMVLAAISAFAMFIVAAFLNSSRERVCYPTCQNNERQIALALNAYSSRHGVWPMSAVEGEGRGRGQTCFMLVMPDLDEQSLYNSYNFSLENWSVQSNGSGYTNAQIGGTRLRVLRCVNNPNVDDTPAEQVATLAGSAFPAGGVFAKNHYAVNWGGGRWGWGSDFERKLGAFRGVMMMVRTRDGHGVGTRCISAKDVVDGLATTILVGEKRDGQGWNSGGWAGSEFDVGPSPSYRWNDPWGQKVYTGSYHQGGLNLGFADGAVRYVTDKIDRKLWYALITRDGNETVVPTDLEE
jgi:prepilin-type processing-associated H-X9-DG protein